MGCEMAALDESIILDLLRLPVLDHVLLPVWRLDLMRFVYLFLILSNFWRVRESSMPAGMVQ